MKLYMHPFSTTSRAVRLFLAENTIKIDEEVVDLLTGKHRQEPYNQLNPNMLVPMLEDGEMRLTESSAILKYLADRFDSPAYPKDLKQRARVNEVMDWFNANFYRGFGYHLCYPQLFPHHKMPDDGAQAALLARGQDETRRWLQVLNDYWIGPDRAYLCGQQITIADFFGIALVTIGDIIRVDFSAYPNVARWIANMKKLKCWAEVNEAMYGFAGAVKEKPFVSV